ncbi:MAG: hypothetical protein QM489_04185, partial [Candidatus Izemoplasma sp.]
NIIKMGAAVIFFIFGFLKLFQSVPNEMLSWYYVIPFITIIMLTSFLLLLPTIKLRKQGTTTLYKKTAEQLHSFYNDMTSRLEDICLGENVCGKCGGTNCLIGYTKELIRSAEKCISINIEYLENIDNQKNFDKEKVLESLKLTIDFLKDNPQDNTYKMINQARINFELILYGEYIEEFYNYKKYKTQLRKIIKQKNHL